MARPVAHDMAQNDPLDVEDTRAAWRVLPRSKLLNVVVLSDSTATTGTNAPFGSMPHWDRP